MAIYRKCAEEFWINDRYKVGNWQLKTWRRCENLRSCQTNGQNQQILYNDVLPKLMLMWVLTAAAAPTPAAATAVVVERSSGRRGSIASSSGGGGGGSSSRS
jgi:hypothetical protein